MVDKGYQTFLKTAQDKGLLNEFDAPDLEIAARHPEFGTSLMYLKERYKNAETDEQKALAHEAANQLRSSYSGAGSGGTAQQGTGGAYGGEYSAALTKAMQGIGQSYEDWKKGDAYGELKQDYEQAGQRAMQNTLAQVSSRTGGLASSYAGQAAQGSYNEYIQALNDAAYNRYQSDIDRRINEYSILKDAENTEYSRYLDALDREQQAAAMEREISAEERAEARDTVDAMISYGATLDQIPADLLAKSGYGASYVNAGSEAQRRSQQAGAQEQAVAAAYGGDYSKLAAYYGVDEATARGMFTAQYLSGGSGTGAGAVQEQGEPYSPAQYQNYKTILNGLRQKANADGDYDPLNYIKFLEKRMGDDYYRNLIGDTLYNRLIDEAGQYSGGSRAESSGSESGAENMGALYSAMMSAEDPEAWLRENSVYMTQEELETALGWLG